VIFFLTVSKLFLNVLFARVPYIQEERDGKRKRKKGREKNISKKLFPSGIPFIIFKQFKGEINKYLKLKENISYYWYMYIYACIAIAGKEEFLSRCCF